MKKYDIILCDCGDSLCKREVKGSNEGELFIINHFTCGFVKKELDKFRKFKL